MQSADEDGEDGDDQLDSSRPGAGPTEGQYSDTGNDGPRVECGIGGRYLADTLPGMSSPTEWSMSFGVQ